MSTLRRHGRVLLVDDSPETLELLGRNLTRVGLSVEGAASVTAAVELLSRQAFDIVVTDLRMPGRHGIDLVRIVRERHPETVVMVITGYATVESAVQAIKTGAEEYLAKPFTDEELLAAVDRALGKVRAARLRSRSLPGGEGLVGASDGMVRAIEALGRARAAGAHVLVAGEPGTGRRAVARALQGTQVPLLAVDCTELPDDGRSYPRLPGKELAPGGTLYVTGVEWASPDSVQRLLELLEWPGEEGCRVVVGAPAALARLVEQGLFPETVLRAVGEHRIVLPPLRERGNDALLLAEHFLRLLAVRLHRAVPLLAPATARAVREYPWPGNVAELQAVLMAAVLGPEAATVELLDLPLHVRDVVAKAMDLDRPLAEVEEEYVRRVLQRTGGNRSRAAEILDIDRKTLREKVRGAED